MAHDQLDDPDQTTRRAGGGRLVLAGVVAACVLGVGLGLWARPTDGRPGRDEADPAEAVEISANRKLQIVVEDAPPPVLQPLEVMPAGAFAPAEPPKVEPRAPSGPTEGLMKVADLPALPPALVEPAVQPKPAAEPARPAPVRPAPAKAREAERPAPKPAKVVKAKAEPPKRAEKPQTAAKSDRPVRQAKAEQTKAKATAAKTASAKSAAVKAASAKTAQAKAAQAKAAQAKAGEARALDKAKAKAKREATRLAEARAAKAAKARRLAKAREAETQRRRQAELAQAKAAKAKLAVQRASAPKPAVKKAPAPKAAPRPPARGEGPMRVAKLDRCASADAGEALVCADPRLSQRERQLQRAFRNAEAAGVPSSALQRQQERWRAARSAAARDGSWAVEDVYEARIAELNDLARDARP